MDVAILARACRAFADVLDPGNPLKDVVLEQPAPEKEAGIPKEDKPKEITLADIQELGAALIRAGKRSELREMLTKHGLKNLSSIKPEQFQTIAVELAETLN